MCRRLISVIVISLIFQPYFSEAQHNENCAKAAKVESERSEKADISPRVVGGGQADYAPWQIFMSAQLKSKDIKTEGDIGEGDWCGGSIISKRYILTATHCVEKAINLKVYNIYVLAGELNRCKVKNFLGKLLKAEELHVHPDYSRGHIRRELGINNDIAIIKVILC